MARRFVLMGIIPILRTRARRTDTTALTGLWAASSLALAHGIAGTTRTPAGMADIMAATTAADGAATGIMTAGAGAGGGIMMAGEITMVGADMMAGAAGSFTKTADITA